MAHTSAPDLLVLHALRIRGLAEPHHVVESTGLAELVVTECMAQAAAAELVSHRDGRMSGWSLTAAGRDTHADLLAADRAAAACDEPLTRGYERFVALNEELKVLCTDWQLRPVGGERVPNDHADAAYDRAIADRLTALHRDVVPVLAALADALARMAPYGARLGSADARFAGGDRDALARPLSGSYHDVWMELHQDLLLTLGRERSASDGH